jgi:hypothetical protein
LTTFAVFAIVKSALLRRSLSASRPTALDADQTLRIAAVDVALGEFQTLSTRSATSGIGRPHIPCSTTKARNFLALA